MRCAPLALVLLLCACKKTEQPAPPPAPPAVEVKGRRVDITADARGFTPSSVAIKQGEPTTLVFYRATDDNCAEKVVFPEINLEKDLPLKQPVLVELPVDKPRTLAFQCGMKMYKGRLVIE